jgi:hypothetical protein
MFGVSTAMIFTLILRLTQARFVDLKDCEPASSRLVKSRLT